MKSPDSEARPDPARVEQLFHEAGGLSTAERDDFLVRACGSDARLRGAVGSLLAASRKAAAAWDRTALDCEARESARSSWTAHPGEFFGPYRIVRRVAVGGMSFVYEAHRDDAEFHKRVAIKFVQHDIGASGDVEQFRSERQILAALEHPNIARLLDGGTTGDGIPYLVMEYVDGPPIDRFANESGLSRTQRLSLFLQVCEALQYAHRNLVVHRDVKPGNILVTADGVPKLLDFGIAKLLTGPAGPKATTIRALTPEYASPEQVMGHNIGTGSDIYSLGVLLFVLLTERLPYRAGANEPVELIRCICEEEPVWEPKRLIHGDLRNVLGQALRKEPERRYLSVEQFAADIRRYLENRPVVAREPSRAYYAVRFFARNKVLTVLAASLLVAVFAGLAGFAWQARRAERQRTIAERRFDEARQLIHSVIHEIQPQMARIDGTASLRKSLIEKTLSYLEALSESAPDHPALMRELIDSYVQLAAISGDAGVSNVGDNKRAIEILQRTEGLAAALSRADPASPNTMRSLLGFYRTAARQAAYRGTRPAALNYAKKGMVVAERLAAMPGAGTASQNDVASAAVTLADVSEDADIRIALLERSLAIWRGISDRHPTDSLKRNIALAYKDLSGNWTIKADYKRALDCAAKARALDEQLLAQDPSSPQAQMALAFDLGAIGWAQFLLKDYSEAAKSMRQNVALRDKIAGANPDDLRAADRLAYALFDLAKAERLLGGRAAERRDLLRTIDLYGRIYRRGPLVPQSLLRYAASTYALGEAESGAGKKDQRCDRFRQAFQLIDEYERREHSVAENGPAIRSAALTCRP